MTDHSNPTETATNGDDLESEIIARYRAGEKGVSIAADLKARGIKGWSLPTLSRFRRAKLGALRARKSKTSPLPGSPEEIPAGAAAADLDWWLQLAEKNARKAEIDGNLAMMGNMGRLAMSLFEAKRKATPDPKPDPNEAPDVVEAATRVRTRWHTLMENFAKAVPREMLRSG